MVKNLTKRFGEVIAVDNLSIVVEDGEFLSILGPSGCGKTTLLRTIAGLEEPDSGSIWFDDREITNILPRDRGVGMVFENYALYPHMTVYRNVSYPLRAGKQKFTKVEIHKKVLAVLELVNISVLVNRFPRELSGGQKQRVALARAIVVKYNIYLFDEVISALDAKLRARMRGEVRRLQKDLGLTTVLVTHDQIEAMTMSDRILVMNFGKIQQIGTVHELYDKPRNVFVATFVGSPEMNLFECELREEEGKALLVGDHLRLPISCELMKRIDEKKTSSEILLGCRPVDLVLHPQPFSNEYPLNGTIFVYEPLGVEQLVEVQMGEKKIWVTAPAALALKMDEPVGIETPKRGLFVFDKLTGLNIGL